MENKKMTKNRTKEICIITGVIISLCIVLTLVLHLTGVSVKGAMDTNAADSEIVHAGAEITDYNLIVLEDEELPAAAAAPVEDKASKALWVMTAAFIGVLLIGYELWYEGTQSRIKALSVGDKEEEQILRGVNRLHPFRAINAKKEMESKAAEVYFK